MLAWSQRPLLVDALPPNTLLLPVADATPELRRVTLVTCASNSAPDLLADQLTQPFDNLITESEN